MPEDGPEAAEPIASSGGKAHLVRSMEGRAGPSARAIGIKNRRRSFICKCSFRVKITVRFIGLGLHPSA
jgi:hypothetical protein